MRIKRRLIYQRGGTPVLEKIRVARRLFSNWPMLLLDRTGVVNDVAYRTRDGLLFVCRGNTSDIGVVGAVLDGREYPAQYLDVPDGAVVLDVGANIGAFTVYLRSLNRQRTYRTVCFEPFEENFRLLKANVALNDADDVGCVNAAVADKNGWVSLATTEEMGELTFSNRVNAHADDANTVPAVRLSTYCKDNDIDEIHLVKMDIEGAEYEVFEADADFFKTHVRHLIVEYHDVDKGRSIEWIKQRLEPAFSVEIVAETPRTGVFYATRL